MSELVLIKVCSVNNYYVSSKIHILFNNINALTLDTDIFSQTEVLKSIYEDFKTCQQTERSSMNINHARFCKSCLARMARQSGSPMQLQDYNLTFTCVHCNTLSVKAHVLSVHSFPCLLFRHIWMIKIPYLSY